MKNQIQFHVGAGDVFSRVAEKAQTEVGNYAQHGSDVEIYFDFNGVKCVVDAGTDLKLLFRDYCNAHDMDWKEVGPNCVPEYSEAVKQDLAEKKQALQEKMDAQQQAYETEMQQKRAALEAETAGVELDIINLELWQKCQDNNQDEYGSSINAYAARWGKLMQARMRDGATVAQVAEKASYDADIDGVTGFMHGAARQTLVGIWKYGQELKEWHEKYRISIY